MAPLFTNAQISRPTTRSEARSLPAPDHQSHAVRPLPQDGPKGLLHRVSREAAVSRRRRTTRSRMPATLETARFTSAERPIAASDKVGHSQTTPYGRGAPRAESSSLMLRPLICGLGGFGLEHTLRARRPRRTRRRDAGKPTRDFFMARAPRNVIDKSARVPRSVDSGAVKCEHRQPGSTSHCSNLSFSNASISNRSSFSAAYVILGRVAYPVR